jgi:hypothetical protein
LHYRAFSFTFSIFIEHFVALKNEGCLAISGQAKDPAAIEKSRHIARTTAGIEPAGVSFH